MKDCYEYESGCSVFIYSGKYMSYIGNFVRMSQCGKFAFVDVDLSPESTVRRIRYKMCNISKYEY